MKIMRVLAQKHTRGFTVIEVLIAAGILVFILASGLTLVSSGLKAQRNIEVKSSFKTDLKNQMTYFLQDMTNCQNLLTPGQPIAVGTDITLTRVPTITVAGMSTLASVNNAENTSASKDYVVSSIKVTDVQPTSKPAQYLSNLDVQANKASGVGGMGGEQMEFKIPVILYVDASNNFTGCQPSNSGTTNYLAKWTSTGLGSSQVYEDPSSYYVGVGTGTPQAKIDVAGEIKLANSNLGCASTTEGSLRYNSSYHRMEYCTYSNSAYLWKAVGGGSSYQETSFGGTINTGANQCPSGVVLRPMISVKRQDADSNNFWSGIGVPVIDGAEHWEYSVEFGSNKGGDKGHAWNYFARGISRSNFIALSTAAHSFSFRAYVGQRNNGGAYDPSSGDFLSLSQTTSNSYIRIIDGTLQVECLF